MRSTEVMGSFNNDERYYQMPRNTFSYSRAVVKFGQLEDVIEDIVDYTDGEVDGQPTITITFKQSNTLLKLLEELENERNSKKY